MTSAPISGPALAMSAGSALDGKVVFGHERSAGGANTLLLMQSDLDLVNVNVSESSPTVSTVSPAHSEQQQQQDRDGAGLDRLSLKNVHLGAPSTVPSFINPYAAPFVSQQQQPQHLPSAPQQQLSPWSSHGANDKNIPIRRPSGTLVNNQSASFNSSSPLTGPQSSSFYQDLGLMSSSILSNSVSMGMSGGLSAPSTGSLAFSSTSSSRSHSMKFHESDLPEGFLDPNSDFFGDPLSSLTGGDARSGNNNDHIDLLSSLRENSKELRDDSSSAAEEYPLSLSSASHSLSGGVASLASRNAPAQQYPPNNRSRYQQHGQQPPQQYGDGYPDYEYDTSLPNLDPYHQAASNNQVKLRSQTYPSQQPQHQPQQPHMGMGMGGGMGLGLEDYGGHEGAYQQAGYSYHNDGGLHSNVHGGGGGQYGQQQPTSPVYGASSGRAPMVRSHSRNMLLQSQQQQVQGMQQQPKFQHKRYDVAQQFKK